MILRPPVVRERLRKLREVVSNLRTLESLSREEFIASFRNYWLAERGLQLAAEAVFDIGTHILAGQFNNHPSDYEDVARQLLARGVISPDLARRLAGLGGFRNLLVHAYLEIDESRVYEALGELTTFDSFACEIEAFLEEPSPR